MSASLVGLGSAGKSLSIGARVRDGTGITTTVAAAGTPAVVTSATLFTADQDDTGGAITFSGTTGKFTVATQNGVGKYLVLASFGSVQGVNAKTVLGIIFAVEGGATVAAKGLRATKTEPATAVAGNAGVAMAVVNLSAVGDTVEIRLDSTTNGDTVVTRDLYVQLVKIA